MNTNLTECDDCGKLISITAQTCPHCGGVEPIFENFVKKYEFEYKKNFWIWFVICFVGTFLLFKIFKIM